MKPLDVWLNNFNGYPIIVKNYKRGTQAITSRRKQCDFVAIIGYNRLDVFKALESEKLISPVVKKGGNYMAVVAKGDYYDRQIL